MVTALDLPKELVDDIQHRAEQEGRGIDETAAELIRAGLAASSGTTLRVTAEMLAERRKIAEKFMTGEWGTEFQGFEEGRAADRKSARDRDQTWRR